MCSEGQRELVKGTLLHWENNKNIKDISLTNSIEVPSHLILKIPLRTRKIKKKKLRRKHHHQQSMACEISHWTIGIFHLRLKNQRKKKTLIMRIPCYSGQGYYLSGEGHPG